MRRKHQKGHISTVRTGVTPTKERRRQNGGIVAEVIDRDYHDKILVKRHRAVWECPLDAYLDHRVISELEHKAGLLFRKAYHRAVLSRSAAYRRLNNSAASIGPTSGDKVLKQAYQTLSPYYKGTIIDICGHDQPARDEVKLDKLQKGLGQLATLWNTAAHEVCWRQCK